VHGQQRERDEEVDFGVGRAADDDDNTWSICTIVPHELGRINEVDEEQLTKQEWEEEQWQQDDEDEVCGGLSLGNPGPLSLQAWA